MNWLDYVIIGVIALSVIISVFRGFVREALSLLVWAVAVWIGWAFFRDLAEHLTPWIELPSLRLAAAMAILIVLVLIIGGLVTYLIGEIIERTGLSGTDRMLGMAFGAARGVLLVAVLVLLAGLTPLPQDPWWQGAALIGYFEEMAIWLRDLLPSDVAERFRFGIDSVIQKAS